jgi:hypothetical protein
VSGPLLLRSLKCSKYRCLDVSGNRRASILSIAGDGLTGRGKALELQEETARFVRAGPQGLFYLKASWVSGSGSGSSDRGTQGRT